MKPESLRHNSDFARAYRKGRAFVHPQLVLYVNKNWAKKLRVGITASKKVGKAVVRNRARRVLRHALWQVMGEDMPPVDVVLVARGQTTRLKSTQLAKALRKLFVQAGLPVKREPSHETPAAAADTGL